MFSGAKHSSPYLQETGVIGAFPAPPPASYAMLNVFGSHFGNAVPQPKSVQFNSEYKSGFVSANAIFTNKLTKINPNIRFILILYLFLHFTRVCYVKHLTWHCCICEGIITEIPILPSKQTLIFI